MFEKVTVGIDTDDDAGIDAIALARQLVSPRGRLALVHVLVVRARPAPDSGSFQAAVKHRRAVEELTDLAQELAPRAWVSCVEAPSVGRGLHEFASTQHADLLVVGASRSDEVAQLLLGDHTVEVLQDAPCPVAVAPIGYAGRAATIQRIGVAYDGSAGSEQAVALARVLAADRDAELAAFEVVPAPLDPTGIWDVRGEVDHHVEEARRRVAALGGVDAGAQVGEPVDELARYAPSVDLLVIGSHKYRPIDRLTQATTAQQLAGRASSPLLVLSCNGRATDESVDAG